MGRQEPLRIGEPHLIGQLLEEPQALGETVVRLAQRPALERQPAEVALGQRGEAHDPDQRRQAVADARR